MIDALFCIGPVGQHQVIGSDRQSFQVGIFQAPDRMLDPGWIPFLVSVQVAEGKEKDLGPLFIGKRTQGKQSIGEAVIVKRNRLNIGLDLFFDAVGSICTVIDRILDGKGRIGLQQEWGIIAKNVEAALCIFQC